MKLNYFNDLYGWGTWIRTKIDGVRVTCGALMSFAFSVKTVVYGVF